MDNDDRQVGRILSRREVLTLIGGTAAALLVGCGAGETGSTTASSTGSAAARSASASASPNPEASEAANPSVQATLESEVATAEAANTQVAVPNCVVRPEVTEGPYYVDVNLVRSDIREDRAGTPLELTFNVSQVDGSNCTAFEGATVEIWHCDAEGAYSGVSDPGFDTSGQTWLRGAQVTDANGVATFTTIYPGWYQGRTVHIHFKVLPNENQVFTSQLFFPDDLSPQVYNANSAYQAKATTPDTLNSTDNIYQELLLLRPSQSGDSYTAAFDIGIDLSTVGTGQDSGPGGPPPRGPRPGASASATTTP